MKRTPEEQREYLHIHYRIRRLNGKASEYGCWGWPDADCDDQAMDWAWIHDTDPADPENYIALCRQCHRDYDYEQMFSYEVRARISAAQKDYWARVNRESHGERVKAGLARRKAEGLPIGRLPGAKDVAPRKRSGYVAAWEPGGARRSS